jgi:branched-chain amino acid transport system substrate-binding protein
MFTARGVRRRGVRSVGVRWLLAGLVCALVAVGCGNRLSRDEILAQNVTESGSGGGSALTPGAAGGTGGTAGTGGDETTSDTVPLSGDAGAVAPAAGDTGADQGAGGTAPAGGTEGGRAPAGGTASAAGTGAAAGTKAPLRIAMVGWLSGIGGQTSTYARDVLVAWSKWVNAKGGINGHPVQLYVADDGGNEARSVSIVRDFVENKKVVALVYYTGGSAVGVANYVKSKNVPVIGGNIIEPIWTQNPMLFPTQAATDGHFWGAAKLTADSGMKRVATVFCTEVAACQQSNDVFVKHAREVGLQVTYQGRISFTQPDFTAECLQMRNSGAEAVVPISENSSTVRLAQSCGRQDYRPIYLLNAVNDGMAKIAEFDKAIGNLATFPWFVHGGHPGLDEYLQAMQKYAPNRVNDGVDVQSGAWMAGKAFERAAAKVSDNPTPQEILEGLWSMKNESLGGLLVGGMARTFNRGQPTPETFCVYDARIQGGKWTAPRGMTPVCR